MLNTTTNTRNFKIGNLDLGKGRTRLLTHIGVTYNISSPDEELRKAIMASKAGTDIIADVSLGKRAFDVLETVTKAIPNPVTCLPGYLVATSKGGARLSKDLSSTEILEMTERALSTGVKGITVHGAFRRKHLEMIDNSGRVFVFTSRMGDFIRKWMAGNERENPFYECFEDIVLLAKKYDANISIGTALRSPSVANRGGGFDDLMRSEIDEAGALVELCYKHDVGVMVEGIGHILINRIPDWYNYSKEKCHNAPLRALPMVTDRGMGHDNVTGAIAAAFLAAQGVEVICTMTRAEHVSQPTFDDIRESIIHFRIALAAVNPDMAAEIKVAEGRERGGCHLPDVIRNIIDPKGALEVFRARSGKGEIESANLKELDISDKQLESFNLDDCTMCGYSCPIRKAPHRAGTY